eukprot:TRINITY_DN9695_c0_g1_i1.p1 TRINITY_DN9695_c0_g1~~TRINITY_DN9695_c0_g1_i1.p1  ORF type:complete len:337 (+),score=107.07 TRINITY_DN9695_c0_g1_i1:159-1169(+)
MELTVLLGTVSAVVEANPRTGLCKVKALVHGAIPSVPQPDDFDLYVVSGEHPGALLDEAELRRLTPGTAVEVMPTLRGRALAVLAEERVKVTATSLHEAAATGRPLRCQWLLDAGISPDVPDSQGRTPLMLATRAGQMRVVRLLLDSKACLHATGPSRWTCLMEAACSGMAEISRELIRRGADVHASDAKGWTSLMLAAEEGSPAVCKQLIDSGADVNARSASGWTCLMQAAKGGCVPTCRLLLDHGAEINAAGACGWTSLMLGARWGHTPVCALLLESGANIDAVSHDGTTVLEEAMSCGREDTKLLLRERCGSLHHHGSPCLRFYGPSSFLTAA